MDYTKYMTKTEKEHYVFHSNKWKIYFQISIIFLTMFFICLAITVNKILDLSWVGLGFLFASLVVFLLGYFLHLSETGALDAKYRKHFERQWKKEQ